MATYIGSKVLVPLDGSRDVRAALGPAAEIVSASDGELILVLVVTPGFERMVAEFVHLEHATPEQAAKQYLYQVEQELVGELDDVVVRQVIHTGEDAAAAILGTIEEVGATMIAMTSHGHTGFRQLMLGSVAQSILDRSHIPVLLVPSRARGE